MQELCGAKEASVGLCWLSGHQRSAAQMQSATNFYIYLLSTVLKGQKYKNETKNGALFKNDSLVAKSDK